MKNFGLRRPMSSNRKSKTCTELRRSIQNRKLVGIVAVALILTVCGARANVLEWANKVIRSKLPRGVKDEG